MIDWGSYIKTYLIVIMIIIMNKANFSNAMEKQPKMMLFMCPAHAYEMEAGNFEVLSFKSFYESEVFLPSAYLSPKFYCPSLNKAQKISKEQDADFMIYFNFINKTKNKYQFSAELINTRNGETVTEYSDHYWSNKPPNNQRVMDNLISEAAFAALNKYTVHLSIESSPETCEIYRYDDHIGTTSKDGYFSKTVRWKPGWYLIKISKIGYIDSSDWINLTKHKMRWRKKFILKRQ
jgi:hypothetical protein